MATMHCDIVSAEKEIFSGEVTMVSMRGTIGELGIYPGHAPLLTGVHPGAVTLHFEEGEKELFFASGGFVEIQPGVVTVLADTVQRAEDIDEAAAEEARQAAERELADNAADFDFGLAAARLAEASAQLRTPSLSPTSTLTQKLGLTEIEIEYPVGHRRRRDEGIPILHQKFKKSVETCFDGKKNQDEEEVDCGGVCTACKSEPETEEAGVDGTAVAKLWSEGVVGAGAI